MTSSKALDLEYQLLPDQFLETAAQAARQGDLEQARALCEQILELNPYHVDALLWQSVVAPSFEAKFALLRRAIGLQPDNGQAKMLMGWANTRQARGEAVNVPIEIELLAPCPMLGTRDDPHARFTYACPGNLCHAEVTKRHPPREVPEDTQEATCLTASHLACPTYCRAHVLGQRERDNGTLYEYFDFFGLDEEPFSIVPVPRFFYPTAQHEEALQTLKRVIAHRQGLATLCAPVGMGKTLILRMLYEELFADPAYAVVMMTHPSARTEYTFMKALLQAARIDPERRRSLQDLDEAWQSFVTSQVLGDQRTVVLLIDEAHQMRPRVLRQVRKLLDHQVYNQQMLQVVLAGQMPLIPHLERQVALQDRVVAQCKLTALVPSEVKALLSARMHEAGSRNGLFTPDAIRAITEATGGRPRRVNVLAMRCLWEAYNQHRRSIDRSVVMRALRSQQELEKEESELEPARTGGVLTKLRLLWERNR